MKRLLYLVMAVVILLSLAVGCGKADEPKDAVTQPADNATTADEKPTEEEEVLEPITFTLYSVETDAYPDTDFNSPVAKEILKKTGVTLKIENAISSDAGKQKISLMAASGDYPDLVYAKGDLNILKNVNAILKLDDLIEQYGPNIKKFFGESDIKRLRWDLEDPGIYYIGSKEVIHENMQPNAGFQLQLGAVKELGFPRLRTLQDFENAIKTYYDAHRKTADGQDMIPLSLLADDWRFLITVSNPANFATGNSDDGEWYVNPETLECVRHLTREEDKEYFRWLNHMNAIGLLDNESFVQKYDQYKAKIATGRVIALADARWEIDEPVTALKKDGKFEAAYGYFPITLNESIKFADFQYTGYLGGWGIAITTNCADPVRAMKFFDWMCTEEAQILTHWGIEGEHYTIENGKRVLKPEILTMRDADPAWQQKTGIKKYMYPFPTYGNCAKDSTGQYYEAFDTLEAIIALQSPIENEVLAAYGVRAWKELYPQSDEFPVKSYGAAWLVNIEDPEWKAADDKILKLGYKMIPQAILADPSQFDAKWEEYQKALKDAGIDEVSATFTKALQDRSVLWQ
jgi:putative aldouronate transport system substrate-binding protein